MPIWVLSNIVLGIVFGGNFLSLTYMPKSWIRDWKIIYFTTDLHIHGLQASNFRVGIGKLAALQCGCWRINWFDWKLDNDHDALRRLPILLDPVNQSPRCVRLAKSTRILNRLITNWSLGRPYLATINRPKHYLTRAKDSHCLDYSVYKVKFLDISMLSRRI